MQLITFLDLHEFNTHYLNVILHTLGVLNFMPRKMFVFCACICSVFLSTGTKEIHF